MYVVGLGEKDFIPSGLGMVRLGRSFSLVRTPRSHRGGRRFKSGPAHHVMIVAAYSVFQGITVVVMFVFRDGSLS